MPVRSPLHTVDIAHPPRHPDDVEAELADALAYVRNSATVRILKIVHGYGSSGKGGTTRDAVRNWAFRRRGVLRAVIPGEDYALLDAATQQMRREAGDYADPDLGAHNRGITVVWVR